MAGTVVDWSNSCTQAPYPSYPYVPGMTCDPVKPRICVPRVKCETCGKLYASKKSLKIHHRIHSGYKPYACHLCPKRFTQTNVLKAHINYHTGRRDWICKICNKAFTQSAHLRTHEKTHSVRKDHHCPYCQQSFSSKETFVPVENEIKAVQELGAFQRETLSVERPRSVRDRHIRQHTGEKPYKCALCLKCFTRGESLKFHENAHRGIRPYKCVFEQCMKTFTKQSSLKRHVHSTHGAPGMRYYVKLCRPKPPPVLPRLQPSVTQPVAPVFYGPYPPYSYNEDFQPGSAGSSVVSSESVCIKQEEMDPGEEDECLLKQLFESLDSAELERLNYYLKATSEQLEMDVRADQNAGSFSDFGRQPAVDDEPGDYSQLGFFGNHVKIFGDAGNSCCLGRKFPGSFGPFGFGPMPREHYQEEKQAWRMETQRMGQRGFVSNAVPYCDF